MRCIISGTNKVRAALLFGGVFFFVIVCKVLFDMAFYEVVENRRLELHDTAGRFRELVEDRADAAQLLINGVDFRNDRPSEILRVLRILQEMGFYKLSVYGPDGGMIVKTAPDGEMMQVDDQYAFQCAQQGKMMISGRNEPERRSYVIFYIPYLMPDTAVRGVMVAKMSSAQVHHLLQKSIVGAESYDFILDLEGQPVHDCTTLGMKSFDFQTDADESKRPNDFLMQSLFYEVDLAYFHVNLENSSWRLVKVVPVASIYREILGAWGLMAGFLLMGCCIAGMGGISIYREWHNRKRCEQDKVKSLTTATQTAAGIAHEIKNPLTSIKGFLSLMIKKENPQFMRENLPTIMAEVKRIETLSNQFCALARPQEKDIYDIVDLTAVVWDVVELNKAVAIEKGVRLTYTQKLWEDSNVVLTIYGNANQIKQVLLNILKNAIEATPRDGEVLVTIYKEEPMYCVQVRDTGDGIRPEDLKRIGTPFYTTKEYGTGLGLLISFDIIQRHGGEIQLSSELHAGTVFTIQLPVYNHTRQ